MLFEILKPTMVWADSADHKLMIFFSFFSWKIEFDILCKLSRCQILFSGKNKKNNCIIMSAALSTQHAKG